jgi:hypothetical protein
MKNIIYKSTSLIAFNLLLSLLILSILCGTGLALDAHKIYFASDSGSTWCRDSNSGPDLYQYSLFSLLKVSPPPSFTILPDIDIPTAGPCSTSNPDINGVGGLKILDWYTACDDSSGNGICSWSCSECGAASSCPIYRNKNMYELDVDWSCCASRRACFDQTDAQYVLLELVTNDLIQVYNFYNHDVDLVVDKAKELTSYLNNQGRTVIWLSYCPVDAGSLGGGETDCTSFFDCKYAENSNTEYFWSKFTPWLNTQQNVYFIDFFTYVKATYGADDNFINQYGYDGIHLNPSGHQIYYDYVYDNLAQILNTTNTSTTIEPTTTTVQPTTTTSINDTDGDGNPDTEDNCPNMLNGPTLGSCMPNSDKAGETCTSDADCVIGCSTNGTCSKNQEDTDADGKGDVCDNCPTTCNPQQLDANGNGIGDLCDPNPECGGGCTQPECEQACGI